MDCLLKNASVWHPDGFRTEDVLVRDGKIVRMASGLSAEDLPVRDLTGLHLLPGLVDVHVHFREPGFLQKECIKTGSMAAAHGGYTTVCTMPNLNPVPDTAEHLALELEAVRRDARIRVLPYGSLTMGEKGRELSRMEEMSKDAVAFSDDGRGLQDEDMMRKAMHEASRLGKIVAAHCEDNRLLHGGYIHDGVYAAAHGHKGISSESEWRQIERDIRLAAETGVKYHVCHISTKESVELIRKAKAKGVDVTCETGPHYLTLCDEDLQEDGRFKMNPPLRSKEDQLALMEGILDGTVDMIITDHAPHETTAKNRGLEHSAMGVVGLETAFAVLYTHCVRTARFSLEYLVELMSCRPSARFGLNKPLTEGGPADIAVFDLSKQWIVHPDEFFSQGKATPFDGWELTGKCVLTLCNGKTAWEEKA